MRNEEQAIVLKNLMAIEDQTLFVKIKGDVNTESEIDETDEIMPNSLWIPRGLKVNEDYNSNPDFSGSNSEEISVKRLKDEDDAKWLVKNKKLRAVTCYCFKRKWLSLTLRAEPKKDFNEDVQKEINGLDKIVVGVIGDDELKTFIKKDDFLIDWVTGARNKFIFTNESISNSISDLIIGDSVDIPTGLIIICASTKSGKSCVAQEIMRNVLYKKLIKESEKIDRKITKENGIDRLETTWRVGRRPHLVTLEDPIEKPIQIDHSDDANYLHIIQELEGIDYTPRVRRIDVASIDDAIKDLLRQTPTVFYVSEVRDLNEWNSILEFAGTGHLVITTTHSSSITEMFKKLFKAYDVKTPVDRSNLASKILAVVHLKSDKILLEKNESENLNLAFTIPAIWRNTNASKNELISDGIASVLPNASTMGGRNGSLGHRYFVNELINRNLLKKNRYSDMLGDGNVEEKELLEFINKNIENIINNLKSIATSWDLGEM